MEHAKKMILVPSEFMERFPSKPSEQQQHISRIDEEMKNILHTTNIPDNEKWDMYREMFLKYLKHVDNQRKPAFLPIVDMPGMTDLGNPSAVNSIEVKEEHKTPLGDEILNSVPQTFRRKARLLYDRILRSGKIVWDERGVVTIDGRTIPRSNITDLINDAVRPRKTTNPDGWQAFCNALRELNIPQEYIGNQKRWCFIRDLGSVGDETKPLRKAPTDRVKVRYSPYKTRGWEKYRL